MKMKLKKKLKYLIASFLHFRNECKFYFDINKFFKKLNLFFDKNLSS